MLWFALVYLVAPIHAFSAECHDMGFSETLMCSDCQKLAEYVKNGHAITSECEKCCTAEAEKDASVRYSSAQLSVCSWKIARHPSVKSFIESKASTYGNLEIKYARGADPVLKMIGASDGSEDTEMGIGNYEEDDIVEYLAQHLRVEYVEEEKIDDDEEEEM